MTFKKLSEYFKLLEANSSRLKITEILADLFKKCSTEEINKVCYLSLGRLLPQYQGVEFQMAQKMLERAIAKAFGVGLERVKGKMKNLGDLGEVGEGIKVQSSPKEFLRNSTGQAPFKVQSLFKDLRDERDKGELEVLRVYERLMEIAKENGPGSVERKIDKMAALLQDLDELSVRYVVRMPLGKMRLGFSEMTILDGLSWMMVKNKSLRKELEDAYNVVADVGEIAKSVKGSKNIKGIGPKLGTPILPALCQRLGTVEEIVEKLGEFAVEPKYDGTRLQIHYQKCKVVEGKIFTRNLENVTHMFPDIVEALEKETTAKEAIFDGEGVGVDPKTGKYLPFQETIKRKRKHGIEEKAKEIPLKYFVFDILFKDGKSLLKEPLSKRRKILTETIKNNGRIIKLSPQVVTKDIKVLRRYHDEQIKNGLEGVVVKKWHSFYEPGRRGFHWVKFKQEALKKGGGLADTVDCLVMGIYRGKGKRASFGVGAFLVGVRKGEKFVTISKVGTGLSDEQFRELKIKSSKCKVKEKPKEYEVDKNLVPDVWCEPKIVVEIQADNITESPIHTAGLALRFPRLIRFKDDRSPEQVTTVRELEDLFRLQFGPPSPKALEG